MRVCGCARLELLGKHVQGEVDGVLYAAGAAAQRAVPGARSLELVADGGAVLLVEPGGDLAGVAVGMALAGGVGGAGGGKLFRERVKRKIP